MKKYILLVILMTFLAFGASAQTPLDGKWQLESINIGGETKPPIGGNPVTLNINRKKIGGNGGCNSYGGSFSRKGTRVKFADIFSTKMWCEEVPQETQYFNALSDSVSFKILKGKLILLNAKRKNILIFVRQK